MDVSKHASDTKLKSIFQQFDTDTSGNITRENVRIAMQKMGQDITEHEISEIMEKHDKSNDGQLNFDEFKVIFRETSTSVSDDIL